MAWGWVFSQVQGQMAQDDWIHGARLLRLQSCARKVLVIWASCDSPLRISPRMLVQFGLALSTISPLCMQQLGWDFPPPAPCTDLARDYYAAFNWNMLDDARRSARQLVRFDVQDTETVIGKDGEIRDPPSTCGAIVPTVPSELLDRRPRLWMMNSLTTILDLGHRDPGNLHDNEESDVLINALTPKRGRGKIGSLDGHVDHPEHPGVSKRMHMDSPVTIVNQLYDPRPQPCAKETEPTDIEVDQPVNQVIDKPKPVDSLASKLTQLSMDIQSDNEEFVDRHRIWVPPDTQSQYSATAPQMPDELSLDLAVQHCMHGRPKFETLYGSKNDPTLLPHGVFAEMPFLHVESEVFIRDGFDPVLRALHATGVEEVPPETFRTCDGSLGMELPLHDSDYRVWAIKTRNACSRSHERLVGLRIGDPPSGILADNLKKIDKPSRGWESPTSVKLLHSCRHHTK